MKKGKSFLFGFLGLIILCSMIVLIYNSVQTKNGALIKISYNEVKEKIANKDDFVLVVSQSTCSHCATYKPKLKEIASDYNLDIYYIDYDTESSSVQKDFLNHFHLSGATPTTMFIKGGHEVSVLNRLEGDLGPTKVVKQLQKMGFIDE